MSEDTNEKEAERLAKAEAPETNVRNWLLQSRNATLCTNSVKSGVKGFPFGSLVPYALDTNGLPFILIADIAAHTANLRADSRASLFVRAQEVKGDAQSSFRLTVMGCWERLGSADDSKAERVVPATEYTELWARYEAAVPAARTYERTHSFAFWRMQEAQKIRYIAGFGKICWLPGETLKPKEMTAGFGAKALAHMNTDHVENMKEMCKGEYAQQAESVLMTSISSTGFFLNADGTLRWFSFEKEVEETELRFEIIAVLKRARFH